MVVWQQCERQFESFNELTEALTLTGKYIYFERITQLSNFYNVRDIPLVVYRRLMIETERASAG